MKNGRKVKEEKDKGIRERGKRNKNEVERKK